MTRRLRPIRARGRQCPLGPTAPFKSRPRRPPGTVTRAGTAPPEPLEPSPGPLRTLPRPPRTLPRPLRTLLQWPRDLPHPLRTPPPAATGASAGGGTGLGPRGDTPGTAPAPQLRGDAGFGGCGG